MILNLILKYNHLSLHLGERNKIKYLNYSLELTKGITFKNKYVEISMDNIKFNFRLPIFKFQYLPFKTTTFMTLYGLSIKNEVDLFLKFIFTFNTKGEQFYKLKFVSDHLIISTNFKEINFKLIYQNYNIIYYLKEGKLKINLKFQF